jgi:hypothetical protein
MKTIRDILMNKNKNTSNDIEVTLFDLCGMKYNPLISVDVEYTFSRYELTLKPNCRTLKFENLQMYIESNCFEEDNND